MASGWEDEKAPVLDVIIVGGGLSGLVTAREIHQWGGDTAVRWKLLEAQSAFGGRLKNDDSGNHIDLGGAWIWPHGQPRMTKLVKELGVPFFPQPDDDSGGSMRMVGGAVQMIDRLAESLPSGSILLNSPVKSCTLRSNHEDDSSVVEVRTVNDQIFLARKVVLAAPPKMILKHIGFTPPLSRQKVSAMESCPTWMAAVTKVSLLYPTRFWSMEDSNCGLRGSPAFQMYDASTHDGRVKALTFFTLVVAAPTTNDKLVAQQVAEQISTVWAKTGRETLAQQVKMYTAHHVQRWPLEPYISDDPHPRTIEHPSPNPLLWQPEWNGALQFASTEADRFSPGVMEGAVTAAIRVAGELHKWWLGRTGK